MECWNNLYRQEVHSKFNGNTSTRLKNMRCVGEDRHRHTITPQAHCPVCFINKGNWAKTKFILHMHKESLSTGYSSDVIARGCLVHDEGDGTVYKSPQFRVDQHVTKVQQMRDAVAQLMKKLPVFYGNQRFIVAFTRDHRLAISRAYNNCQLPLLLTLSSSKLFICVLCVISTDVFGPMTR
jgi:hypothetical protein